MKLVVVGGVAGGASAAARVRRLDDKAEIVMFERGANVSFSNCCLPYHLSGTVKDSKSLVLMTPTAFQKRFQIDARVNSEVVSIDRQNKTVHVRQSDGKEYDESYDKLILAPGANPVMPKSIKGIDRENVFSIRNVTDIEKLKAYIDMAGVENVAVVGGGFIGVEAAENIVHAGKKVTLIEGTEQIMAPFDYDMAQMLHKELDDNGVDLRISTTLKAVEDGFVTVESDGKEENIKADCVVMAIGVAPEIKLAVDAGLEIGSTRGIKVDHNYLTSDPDIYAVGDAVEIFNMQTHRATRLALAGPAQRQARAAADHIYGIANDNRGVIGSSCVRVFDFNAASTGLNEKAAAKRGYSYDSVLIYANDKVGLMPGSAYMAFKLVFEVPTGLILGAQAIGRGDVTKRIDIIATLITMHGKLTDLRDLELCYSPVYSTAKDVTNMAAYVALNVLNKVYNQVHVSEIRNLVESGAYIVDVREEKEYRSGHLKGAHNIPLSQLHERMNEIPKDVPVYLHCRSSQRSYYAIKKLINNGYRNCYNLSGSYLGFSYYEYFNDKRLGREPILTRYNFK